MKFGAWLRKCWIGNLPEGTQWKALQEHMNQAGDMASGDGIRQAGKTTWVECFSGKGAGTGGVSYSTAEEAANAITMLNGTGRACEAVWMECLEV